MFPRHVLFVAALFAAPFAPSAQGFQGQLPPLPRQFARAFPPQEPPVPPPGAPTDEGSCEERPPEPALVHLGTGEFHLRVEDLRIAGRGLDFRWTRTYRSRADTDAGLGRGWDWSYDIWIEAQGPQIAVHDGNGRRDLFQPRPDGTYAADGFFQQGSWNTDGSFTLLFADGGAWRFHRLDGTARAGRIESSTDRNGNALAFAYDSLGRLMRVTDTLGRDVTIARDSAGRISSVCDFAGRCVSYAYYTAADTGGSPGDLRSATSPIVTGTPNGNDYPSGKTTFYGYSRGQADERLNHNLLWIRDPRGQTWISNAYAATTDPGALDFDRLERQVLSGSDVFDIVYVQPQPEPLLPPSTELQVIVNDAVGNVREFFYDRENRCVLLREFTGRADPAQPTSTTANRPTGRLRASDPAIFETRWEWNRDSRPTRIVRPGGSITERVHQRDLDSGAAPRARGNLRLLRRLPGPGGGSHAELTEQFEHDVGHGGCCGSNFVTRHVDAIGNVTEHDYDARGNRIQTRFPVTGVVEDFEYDAYGRKTRHVHPDNGGGCRREDRWVWYGTSAGFQNGFLHQEIVDAAGSAMTTSYEYDALGQAVRVLDPLGHDDLFAHNALDQIVRATSRPVDAGGVRYRIDSFYDANDNLERRDVLAVDHLGAVEANSLLTTTREYDVVNRLVRLSEEVDATHSVVTEWGYDANGNRTLERQGEAVNGNQPGNVVRTLWDERDLPFQRIRAPGDPAQSTDQHDYDGNRNRVRLAEGLEGGAQETFSIHDGYDRLILAIDALGNEQQVDYDANGNVLHLLRRGEMTDGPGSSGNVRLHEETAVFDGLSRRIRREVAHFDPATQMPIGDGLSVTQIEYSGTSQVLRTIGDEGGVAQAAYDCAGRKVLQVDERGNTLGYAYDPNSNPTQITQVDQTDHGTGVQTSVTTRFYDWLGRHVRTVDQLSNATTFTYDSRDNIRLEVDQLGNRTEYEYDGLDRLLTTTRRLTSTGTGAGSPVGTIVTLQSWDDSSRLATQTDPNGNVSRYVYDACDRRVSTLHADGTVSTTTWDAHGTPVTGTDPNGTVITSTHDPLGRPTARTISPGAGVSSDTTFEVFQYDGRSRLVRAEDDDSIVRRAYDSLSNVVRDEQNGLATTALWNGAQERLALQYPGGRSLSYTHDPRGRIRTILEGTLVRADYDYIGNRVRRRSFLAGAIVADHQYDGLRRLVRTTVTAGTVVIEDRRFAWDAMDDRVEREDLRAGGPRLTHAYSYDSANRLRHATVTSPTAGVVRDTDYALDPAGNRTSVSGDPCAGAYVLSTVVPEPADRPMNQYTSTPCDQRTYDRNGNLVAVVASPTSSISCAYDGQNRLVAIGYGALGTDTYAYDALGRRIARVLHLQKSTQGTRYLYDGWQVVEQRSLSGAVIATYVWGAGLDEILGMRRGTIDSWFHADSLGSVTAATNNAGSVVERYEYGDAGLPSFFSGTGVPRTSSQIGNPHLFGGARYDDSGLYWLRRRYLDPRTGRFLSRDPIGTWEDLGNLGNALTHAANNPQTLVDPMGTTTIDMRCNGPWPGPRTLELDIDDCSGSREDSISDMSCVAFRAVGQAYADLKRLVDFYQGELDDVDWGDLRTELQVNKWFGGQDDDTSLEAKDDIRLALKRIYRNGFRNDNVGFECESSCDSGTNAYVYTDWFTAGTTGSDIHLCSGFFSKSARRQEAIILHEMSHEYAFTDDKFYYSSPANPNDRNESTRTLKVNADTYEEFLLDDYIP